MAITLHHEPSWSSLLARVAADWRAEPLGVFETDTVVTSSASTGRLFRQQIAPLLGAAGEGICAGVETLTIAALRRRLSELVGAGSADADPWRSRALTFTIHESLRDLVDRESFGIVAHHLGELHDPAQPGRWLATASAFQRLLSSYVRRHPDLVRAWNHGHPVDATGEPLDTTHRWQFELWTHLRSMITVPDPVTAADRLCAEISATGDGLARLTFIEPAEPAPLDRDLVRALGRGGDVTVYRLPGRAVPPLSTAGAAADDFWASAAGEASASVERRALAPIELHASHGPKRQVEVLREVLCRLFADDPTLEPRDVVVFSPNLALYAPLLQALFTPGSEAQGWQHPGTRLRGQVSGFAEPNLVLGLVRDLLELPGRRASASELIDLCRTLPVAHRFGFSTEDLASIQQWVAQSNVRWGVDAAHRSRFHLAEIRQNTWLSGLDMLLVGVAMGQAELASVGHVLASDAVDSADVELLGRFAEFVSRVRKTLLDQSSPATVTAWVDRLTTAVDLFCELPSDHAWMLYSAWAELAALRQQAGASTTLVSRAEMAHALDDLLRGRPRRPAVGNGSLTFAPLGDLRGVGHRVVCLLGVSDSHQPPRADGRADALPLPADPLSDPRGVARQQLMDAVAAASDRAVIVYQGRSDRTNEELPTPIVLTDLSRLTGGDVARHTHPLQPHSPENFAAVDADDESVASFDVRAALAANAQSTAPLWHPTPLHVRLRELPEIEVATVTAWELANHFEDPAKSLFRRRQGLPASSDGDAAAPMIPIEVTGLERWRIGDRLLRLARQGVPMDAAAAAEHMRGSLPPQSLGRTQLQGLAREVNWIVAAERRFGDEPRSATIDLDVDGVQVVGSAAVRGDTVVVADFGATEKFEFRAWVHLLALRASGHDLTRAAAIGRDWRHNAQEAEVVMLSAPPQDEARELLAELVASYRRGSSDVIPTTNGFARIVVRAGERQGWLRTQLRKQWRYRSAEFKRVFGPSIDDLLALPPLPTDPGPGTEPSRFLAMSRWLHGPIKQARVRASDDVRV